jgi:hypothetical protein
MRRPLMTYARWAPAAVFVLGAALRLYGLGEWSLWEDEETTIFFSYHPDRSFPTAFPTFFLILGLLFDYTGCSVLAGRLLSASFGIGSLALTYGIVRRFEGPRVALVALMAISVSPGHLFWSQSIRYYGLAYLIQLMAVWLLLEGNRRRRLWLVLSALVASAVAITCHRSAALLLPVLIAYEAWLAWRSKSRWHLAALAILVVPAVLALVVLRVEVYGTIDAGDSWRLALARDPLHVSTTGAFYFGAPALALAIIGAWREFPRPRHDETWLFGLLAVVPIAAQLGLTMLDTINVTYYYGLIAFAGLAVLAGYGAEAMLTWRPVVRRAAIAAAVVYYVVVLVAYYGPSYGDRPRWRDAAGYIAAHRGPDPEPVYATVPGVIAFYLGVPPDQTMGHPQVKDWPEVLPEADGAAWFVAERRLLTPADTLRLTSTCREAAQFASTMLVRDRTVVVYRCGA